MAPSLVFFLPSWLKCEGHADLDAGGKGEGSEELKAQALGLVRGEGEKAGEQSYRAVPLKACELGDKSSVVLRDITE